MGVKKPQPLPDNPPPRGIGIERPTSPPPPRANYKGPTVAKPVELPSPPPAASPRYKLAMIRARERLADAIASRDKHYAEGDKAWGAYHEGRRQELAWMLDMLGDVK